MLSSVWMRKFSLTFGDIICLGVTFGVSRWLDDKIVITYCVDISLNVRRSYHLTYHNMNISIWLDDDIAINIYCYHLVDDTIWCYHQADDNILLTICLIIKLNQKCP